MTVDVVSVEQAGEILGCKRSKIFELLAEGKLQRAPRIGRSLRIFRDSVDQLLRPAPKRRRKAPRRVASEGFAALRASLRKEPERRLQKRSAPETFDEVLKSIR